MVVSRTCTRSRNAICSVEISKCVVIECLSFRG